MNTSWKCICMFVYICCCLVAKSCPTRLLCPWMSQARILEWVAISFSKESPWPRDWTPVSYIAGGFFYYWATGEACVYLYAHIYICIHTHSGGCWELKRQLQHEVHEKPFLKSFFFFLLHDTACEIIVLWLWIEPVPPAVETQSPPWPAREVSQNPILMIINK